MFNLFKKKEAVKAPAYIPLKVREVVKETSDTVTLYFDQPEPFMEYKPGQFLTLVIMFAGKEERRSYSLCTSPYVDPFPGISVKKLDKGIFSNFLTERVFPGKTINILKPQGNFTTDFHSKNKKHFLLIAGGSGITPIMGILKSVLANEPLSKVTLLYCSRNEEQIIFKKELDSLQENNPDRLKIVHNLSQPSEAWTGLKGRLTKETIFDYAQKAEGDQDYEKEYFACGPEGIMDNYLAVMDELNVPKEKVHHESFYSSAAEKAHEEAVSGNSNLMTRDVTVVLDDEEHLVTVTPDKTVLEAGLELDLNMPYSCQSGLCTACRGKLISGKVKMDEDEGLSENEKEQGYILCCVARPLTDDVKINIE